MVDPFLQVIDMFLYYPLINNCVDLLCRWFWFKLPHKIHFTSSKDIVRILKLAVKKPDFLELNFPTCDYSFTFFANRALYFLAQLRSLFVQVDRILPCYLFLNEFIRFCNARNQ